MTPPQEPTSEESGADLPESELLAAEYALSLLDAQGMLDARGRMARDPDFATMIAGWEDRFAPLMEQIPPARPSDEVWPRIEAALDNSGFDHGKVVELDALRRRLRVWKLATGLSAAAAVALAFLALPSLRTPAPEAPVDERFAAADPLVASIPIGDTQLRLGVTYLPDREEMLISASGLAADGIHDHELWVVTGNRGVMSLGVVAPGEERRMSVNKELAQQLHDGSSLLLTREPLGGAPPNGDAGPVVASGHLRQT